MAAFSEQVGIDILSLYYSNQLFIYPVNENLLVDKTYRMYFFS
jgi:hypothetical protein